MTDNNEDTRLHALYAMGILDTRAEERFDRLTRIAAKLFDVPITLVSLVDKDRQWFKSKFGLTINSTPRIDSFCTVVVEEGKALVVNDAMKDYRFSEKSLVTGEPYIRFYAGYPVKLPDGEIAGAICIIDTHPRSLSEIEFGLLKDLAEVVEDEFRIIALATIDSLTGICNRRSFSMIAEETLRKAKKRKKKFSISLIDLDNFKRINDTWGHSEGNAALIAFSNILDDLAHDHNIIARLGGDEFGILLPDTAIRGANKFINDLSAALASYNMTSNKPHKLSFSAGTVEFDEKKHQTLGEMLKDADDRMYLVKRNRKQLESLANTTSAS
ncbi:sensor domain-containing diguanylate cyclase [Rahnella sp. SAP-1]|uniref:diguanylate cyclase n=1 Tax=Rouxiella aceris TaxID=2703884 RepID=A0A848MKA7_9GAMM|nr:sensor domain-containing diguanylate cyclase [Rouxiella aceris]NMP28145.1 sensor domain-containing diguanylate cyclase [Rouxiella aceris]